MPLLGRHKSNSQSPSQSPPATAGSSTSAANSRQQLCESPLFGIRRQLPTVSDGPNSGGGNNNLVSKTGSNRQQQQQLHGANSTGLSSIPQQITRQQIHYAFSIIDSNKDGQVDGRDLSQMLSNLGIPIDEAILSHIMKNTVSKRGDHRISEAEFLDWLSHFIQIRNEPPTVPAQAAGQQQQKRGSQAPSKTAVRVTRSSTAGSSLVAQPSEVPRARRGSGSGLALMRSLSSSSASTSATERQHNELQSQSCDRLPRASSKQSMANKQLEHQSSTDSVEAKNDLKAAFCVFDLDGDGFITVDEVQAGLKLLGESWSPMELRRVFSKCKSSPTSDLTKQRISIDDFVQLLL